MKNTQTPKRKLNVFMIALLATFVVGGLFVILLFFMDLTVEAAGTKIALLSGAFTSFSVIWIAAGIILTQRNLDIYSRELLEQRREFQIQSRALMSMQSSMQLSSYFRLYDHTVTRLDKLGAYVLAVNDDLRAVCDDFGTLHENEELQNLMASKLTVPSGFRLREDLESYINIFRLCKKEVDDLPQKNLISRALFHGKRISKNTSVIEVLLSQSKL